MVVLTAATVTVGLVALASFGLVLVLARRLRSVTERVNAFLPVMLGTLPRPGTVVGEFSAVALTGEVITRDDFLVEERVFAVLSTGCGDCQAEVAAFAKVGARLTWPAVVGVIGRPEARRPMVAALAEHVVVLEESTFGPLTEAFQVSEFPVVLLVRDGRIQAAEHALAPVLAAMRRPVLVD
ncbi:MAG: hypothetical protein ACR2N4_11125 [Jatrophihabitans sp.]